MAIERDKEVFIWTHDAGHARHFFGFPEDRPVRVVKEQPETPEEIAKYQPHTKLFAVMCHEPQPDTAILSQEEFDKLLRD